MAKKKKAKSTKSKGKTKGLDPKQDFDQPVRRPRQGRLPGTEDNKILDIEEAAIEHSDIRSEIAAKKVDLKTVEDKIAALMKREGRKEYRRGSIHIRVRSGHDAVSVQVKRHDREEVEVDTGADKKEPEGTEG